MPSMTRKATCIFFQQVQMRFREIRISEIVAATAEFGRLLPEQRFICRGVGVMAAIALAGLNGSMNRRRCFTTRERLMTLQAKIGNGLYKHILIF